MKTKPTSKELQFLNRSYNFFLDIHEEIRDKSFWGKDSYYRISKVRDAILVYSEILEYEPIKWFLEELKKIRPPMEAELSREYILFIRNVLVHFPIFNSWNEIKFTKNMINWSKPGRSIDKFLHRFVGHQEVKYRMWDSKGKKMTYLAINFPKVYENDTEIKLKDFMSEKEGVLFVMSLMHQVLMSQVKSVKETHKNHEEYKDLVK